MIPSNELPTKAGYYWWRETAQGDWIMVQVERYVASSLKASSIRPSKFGERDLRAWRMNSGVCPIGQWLPVLGPEDSTEGPDTEHVRSDAVHRALMRRACVDGFPAVTEDISQWLVGFTDDAVHQLANAIKAIQDERAEFARVEREEPLTTHDQSERR